MSKNTKRTVTIAAVAALAVAVAGAVWVAWDREAHDRAPAATDAAKPVTADIATVSPLFPGATARVVITATNPNGFPVDIPKDKVNIDPDTAAISGSTGHCVNLDLTVNVPDNIVIPANSRNYQITFDNLVLMGHNSDDGCQGASFVLPFTYTAVTRSSSPTADGRTTEK